MSTLNQIKAKLLELEGGRFQRLCDDWLFKKGYENINPIGMMQTTDRVVKGTPDCLIIQPNGKYVFSEYTVQQERLAQKLEDDISKCLDKDKTGISDDEIGEIIICHLGKLSSKEIEMLRRTCSDRQVVLSLYGLDTIALSIKNNYPILSEQYLDLPLDTGQLLPVEDFVKRYSQNKLTTSIENKLLFKDEELLEAAHRLETSDFLLVSGPAGAGKTLFAVNLLQIVCSGDEPITSVCLFDKGADLTKDINAKFSQPGDYLILIDDANRLDNRIDYILHHLHEQDEGKRFRIIATVRDYARDQVKEKAGKFTRVEEIVVTPLSDEQIGKLTDELFGIKNPEYQKRIQDIALGNPRLAVMASKVAVETNQIESIQNVTSLYDDYFGQNESVKEVVEDERLMLAACCISFFRKIDKLNKSQVEMLEANFNIQIEEFWELVGYLHSKEMVDIYENEVVRMSDQVLSTYLFYVSVFEKKIVPFSTLVDAFYPSMKRTIVDALNPVINAFDHKIVISGIRSEVKGLYEALRAERNTDEVISFLQTFWFALPTETLMYAKGIISDMPEMNVDWEAHAFERTKNSLEKSQLVELLTSFRYFREPEFHISVDLLFEYLTKEDSALGSVLACLEETYCFKQDDWKYRYSVQEHVISKLLHLMDAGRSYLFSRIFLVMSELFLKAEHREHRWNNNGNAISIITFRLVENEYLEKLREKLFNGISKLLTVDEHRLNAISVMKQYVSRVRFEGSELATLDFTLIQSHIVPRLDVSDVSHCLLVRDYCEALSSLEIPYPAEWNTYTQHDAVVLSNVLFEDRHERKMLEMGYEEYNKYRYNSLIEYFSGFDLEQFAKFIDSCSALHAALEGRDRDYLLKDGIELSLRALSEVNPDEYGNFIEVYLGYDDTFAINPHFVVKALFENYAKSWVWDFLNQSEFKWKQSWVSAYFSLLPEKDVSIEEVKSLLEHISVCESNQLRGWLDYLDKYTTIEPDIYASVTEILVERSKSDIHFARPLEYLFRNQSSLFGTWHAVFGSREFLVAEAYLASMKCDSHFDYNGEALKRLVENDFEVLFRFVDQIYEKQRWPDSHTNMPELTFLWEREQFVSEIEMYGRYIYEKEKSPYSIRDTIFCRLFSKEKGKSENLDIVAKQEQFFTAMIEKHASEIGFICFIFEAVLYMSQDIRRKMITVFVRNNTNLDDFQKIDYVQTTRSWTGSLVPILEREKDFLTSLLPIFNTIELLDHKSYIEQAIEGKERHIESEKKRDFLES